jgi:hypothetical protein
MLQKLFTIPGFNNVRHQYTALCNARGIKAPQLNPSVLNFIWDSSGYSGE